MPAALALSILFFLASCKGDHNAAGQGGTETTETPAASVPVPSFNRDSAFAFVEKQLSFGPRVPGTEAHKACRQWLVDQLRAYGAEVIEQAFNAKIYTGQTLPAVNIIGQFNPQAGKRILLAAHWDSRFRADSPLSKERRDEPILGADDGASGVAVLLEVARQLQAHPISIGVDIIFFDAEDQGESDNENPNSWALGAQHWARNLHRGGYKPKYGILLDMVGSKPARFAREAYSTYYAGFVVDKVWKLAQSMSYGNYFVDEEGSSVTDDHYFVNTIAGIPMIDIINQPGTNRETIFVDHWHTHNDNLNAIDPLTLRAVGQVMLAVVYRENNQTL